MVTRTYVVRGQRLQHQAPTPEPLVSGQAGWVKLAFHFYGWQEIEQKTLEVKQGAKSYLLPLQEDACLLPSELEEGAFTLVLYGNRADGTHATTNPLEEHLLGSTYTGQGQSAAPPTPDLYDALIAQLNAARYELYKPPRITRRGTWSIYDYEAKDYVDTGVHVSVWTQRMPALRIGTVSTLPMGSNAEASLTDQEDEVLLNLAIPAGLVSAVYIAVQNQVLSIEGGVSVENEVFVM